MEKIKIVTDSAASLTAEEVEKYNITVIPININFGDENYIDGVDITSQEFIEKMAANEGSLPKTSQPPFGRFEELYSQFNQPILSIHMGSTFSGTVNTAKQVADTMDQTIEVFDSKIIDRGIAVLVIAAAKAAEEGQSMEEIVAMLTEMRKNIKMLISIDSLKNLIAGGRISKMAGSIGLALNFKVGLEVDQNGEIQQIAKGRGQKTIDSFYDDVIKNMQEYKNMYAINIPHVGNPELAESLRERLIKIYPDIDIITTVATSSVSTHGGLGGVAIVYYATND